jgi:uncharacterized protein YyaL (SSP411 family)
MDTDQLSTEAYKGIVLEAEKFNHDLTLQFALLAYSCNNEGEYLQAAKELIQQLQDCTDEDLSEIFFDAQPDRKELGAVLNKVLANISNIETVPENQRHYEY